MQVGDFLLWRDEKFGHHRAWKVEAVLLGTEDTEGLVELRPMFKAPGMDADGKRCETVLVPEVLTRNLCRFGGEGFSEASH